MCRLMFERSAYAKGRARSCCPFCCAVTIGSNSASNVNLFWALFVTSAARAKSTDRHLFIVIRLCSVFVARYTRHTGEKERENIYYLPSGNGVCVENCPLETNYTKFICYDEVYPEIFNNDTGEVRINRSVSHDWLPFSRARSWAPTLKLHL